MRYRTIVADPPWPYESWPTSPSRIPKDEVFDGRRTPIKYETMPVSEIAALPIAEWANRYGAHILSLDNEPVHASCLRHSRRMGVRYSRLLVWARTRMGLGPGGACAQSAEYILFGRVGSLGHLRRVDSIWFKGPRTGVHSKKPEAFLDLVEQISPGPYLDLCARRQRFGWDTWGRVRPGGHVRSVLAETRDRKVQQRLGRWA